MKENGYSGVYAGAITAASSVIGPLIPPSIILIFYGAIMNVDVAAPVRGVHCAGDCPQSLRFLRPMRCSPGSVAIRH